MTKRMQTGKVGKLGEGSRFIYGGVEWVVLDNRPNMVLALAVDVLKDAEGNVRYIPFDTDNKNDFAASSLRALLNGDFLEELASAGADKEAFAPIVLDLTSDDGLDDYGTDTAKIGLISDQMYRHFRKLIPNTSDDWWTCTPFSTARNGFEHHARIVNPSGALLSNSACCGNWGVRPLCALKSDILVSYDEAQTKERTLSIGEMFATAIMGGLEKALLEWCEEEPEDEAPAEQAAPDRTEDQPGDKAKELHARFAALKNAGFTEAQALELIKE